MTLYKFYKRPDSEVLGAEYSELYAYTNKKKIAKKFRETRNMDLFFYLTEEISKEDYTEITSVRAGARLDEFLYLTYDYEKKDFYHVQVVTTFEESENIHEMSINGDLSLEFEYVNPFIFKKKWRKILNEIYYIQNFRNKNPDLCIALRQVIKESEIDDKMEELDMYSTPEYTVDELALFCKVYGYLFK